MNVATVQAIIIYSINILNRMMLLNYTKHIIVDPTTTGQVEE